MNVEKQLEDFLKMANNFVEVYKPMQNQVHNLLNENICKIENEERRKKLLNLQKDITNPNVQMESLNEIIKELTEQIKQDADNDSK
jgi:uncharacterized protein YeeX (DUF496 family)